MTYNSFPDLPTKLYLTTELNMIQGTLPAKLGKYQLDFPMEKASLLFSTHWYSNQASQPLMNNPDLVGSYNFLQYSTSLASSSFGGILPCLLKANSNIVNQQQLNCVQSSYKLSRAIRCTLFSFPISWPCKRGIVAPFLIRMNCIPSFEFPILNIIKKWLLVGQMSNFFGKMTTIQ
jgi:hypothetical protein